MGDSPWLPPQDSSRPPPPPLPSLRRDSRSSTDRSFHSSASSLVGERRDGGGPGGQPEHQIHPSDLTGQRYSDHPLLSRRDFSAGPGRDFQHPHPQHPSSSSNPSHPSHSPHPNQHPHSQSHHVLPLSVGSSSNGAHHPRRAHSRDYRPSFSSPPPHTPSSTSPSQRIGVPPDLRYGNPPPQPHHHLQLPERRSASDVFRTERWDSPGSSRQSATDFGGARPAFGYEPPRGTSSHSESPSVAKDYPPRDSYFPSPSSRSSFSTAGSSGPGLSATTDVGLGFGRDRERSSHDYTSMPGSSERRDRHHFAYESNSHERMDHRPYETDHRHLSHASQPPSSDSRRNSTRGAISGPENRYSRDYHQHDVQRPQHALDVRDDRYPPESPYQPPRERDPPFTGFKPDLSASLPRNMDRHERYSVPDILSRPAVDYRGREREQSRDRGRELSYGHHDHLHTPQPHHYQQQQQPHQRRASSPYHQQQQTQSQQQQDRSFGQNGPSPPVPLPSLRAVERHPSDIIPEPNPAYQRHRPWNHSPEPVTPTKPRTQPFGTSISALVEPSPSDPLQRREPMSISLLVNDTGPSHPTLPRISQIMDTPSWWALDMVDRNFNSIQAGNEQRDGYGDILLENRERERRVVREPSPRGVPRSPSPRHSSVTKSSSFSINDILSPISTSARSRIPVIPPDYHPSPDLGTPTVADPHLAPPSSTTSIANAPVPKKTKARTRTRTRTRTNGSSKSQKDAVLPSGSRLPSEMLTPDRAGESYVPSYPFPSMDVPATSNTSISPMAHTINPDGDGGDDGDRFSSDPDNLDSFRTNLNPRQKKDLVKYMLRLRRRQRRVLEKFERRQKEKLSRFHNRLMVKYGAGLQGIGMKGSKRKRESWGGEEEDVDGGEVGWQNIVMSPAPTKRVKREFKRQAAARGTMMNGQHGVMPREEEPEEILNPEQERERNKQRLERARTDLWIEIAQNHIPTAHQLLTHYTTTKLANSAKIAHICRRQVKPSINPKQQAKDLSTRVKKVAKEMMSFWKRNEKEERELRKKAEREALELRKREEEMREAQRQARKLNFLITQTELYSHFIGKKLGNVEDAPGDGKDADDFDVDAEGEDEQVGGSAFNEIDFDDEDETALVARAKSEAKSALAKQRAATRAFDLGVQNRQSEVNGGTKNVAISESTVDQMDFLNPSSLRSDSDITQPEMLTVQLKSYQLKGLNWLANLYEQGINGILADEMGLGKTVQSIALMAYLAEKHGIWGPFLVVSPASTLPNWQQEVARFAPQLKVLPYWGDPDDRKTLRGLLNPKKTGVRDAPFHVAITSYQLIVTDIPQFNRIRWQYMILDEAQAIKSSSSQRWKTLLKMNSRNRLLLTGTPIQNSMQELWSLLHFIMPTLFDSHEEFSDWFSKDIESHVEDNGTLNEHQLRRLHMILKPFMLRRIKRDVENELADKIEVELRCQLSARQKVLYQRLKQKISVRELMDKVASTSSSSSGASTANNGLTSSFGPGGGDEESEDSLMNIVMQFRKVCNHPELFERADVASPFMCIPAERIGGAVLVGSASSGSTAATRGTTAVEAWSLNVPYNVLGAVGFSIPKAWYRAGILDFGQPKGWGGRIARVYECHRVVEDLGTPASEFGFVRLADLGVGEFAHVYAADILARWVDHILIRTQRRRYFSYLNRNGFARPVNSMLCIVNHENTSGKWDDGLEPDVPGRGFTALCSVANDLAEHGILGRLPIAYLPAALAAPPDFTCSDRSFTNSHHTTLFNPIIRHLLYSNPLDENPPLPPLLTPWPAPVSIPPHTKIITNSGKMLLLNTLLPKLKEEGHRVLIFFQMTLMMDLMEEYLAKRQYSYLRLDGSTSIFDRRDLVFEWQSRPELFIFLLSTRAGGLGINLTAADTVIFYDSDWNPTVDQQAMDRSHRLGQTRQVTVYRLITAGTIEERILQRARQKDQIQKVVISGGEFKQQVEFKPKEVLSLLLEDEEMEERVRKEGERRAAEEIAKTEMKAANKAAKISAAAAARRKVREEKAAATKAKNAEEGGGSELTGSTPKGKTTKKGNSRGGSKAGTPVPSIPSMRPSSAAMIKTPLAATISSKSKTDQKEEKLLRRDNSEELVPTLPSSLTTKPGPDAMDVDEGDLDVVNA